MLWKIVTSPLLICCLRSDNIHWDAFIIAWPYGKYIEYNQDKILNPRERVDNFLIDSNPNNKHLNGIWIMTIESICSFNKA